MSIGDRIRHERAIHGITQRDLAAASGVSRAAIAKVEAHAGADISLKNANAVAMALEIELTTLLDEVTSAERDRLMQINQSRANLRHEMKTKAQQERRRREKILAKTRG